jgi:hypothetical protein
MLDDPASSEIDNFYEGALAIIRQQTKDVPHKLVLLVRDLGSATGQQKIDKYVKLRAAVIAQRQYWKGILGYPSDDFNTRTLLGRELGDGLMMLAGWLLIGSTVCMWVVVPMTVYLAVPETFLKTLLTGLSVFLVYGAIILMILSLITLLTAAFLLLIKPLLCNKKR